MSEDLRWDIIAEYNPIEGWLFKLTSPVHDGIRWYSTARGGPIGPLTSMASDLYDDAAKQREARP